MLKSYSLGYFSADAAFVIRYLITFAPQKKSVFIYLWTIITREVKIEN